MSFECEAFGASDESDSQASGSFSAVKIAGSNWIMLSLVVTITFINQICNVTITLPFTKFVDHSTPFGWLSKQFNFFTFNFLFIGSTTNTFVYLSNLKQSFDFFFLCHRLKVK